MKARVDFILLFLGLSFAWSLPAQWESVPSFPLIKDGITFQIDVQSDNSLLVCVRPAFINGIIPPALYHSVDGGTSWDTLSVSFQDSAFAGIPDTEKLQPFGFSAPEPGHIYLSLLRAFEEHGLLVKTTDGGDTWKPVNIPFENNGEVVDLVYFFDRDTGIVTTFTLEGPDVSETGPLKIYRTQDGGVSWTRIPTSVTADVPFWLTYEKYSAAWGDTLWFGSRDARLFRSVDRGASFEVIDLGPGKGRNLGSLAFRDALNGIAIVNSLGPIPFPNQVYRTEDGGTTWERVAWPERLESVEFVPEAEGVIIGARGLATGLENYFISLDGGDTWMQEGLQVNSALVSIVFTGPSKGWGGGYDFEDRRLLYRYAGPPLAADPDQKDGLQFEPQGRQILPDGYAVYDLHVLDSTLIWGVAFDQPQGGDMADSNHIVLVVKSTDGGDTWQSYPVNNAMGRISYDIHALDDQTAWITTQNPGPDGGQGAFLTSDGGKTWAEKLNDPAGGGWIHFFNRSEGVVVNAGSVALTRDGGDSWEEPDQPPVFQEGESTFFASGSNALAKVDSSLWFGTNKGRIFRSRDRGNTWIARTVDPNFSFQSIAFQDEQRGLALPFTPFVAAPFVFSTTNGGDNWRRKEVFFRLDNISFVPGTEASYVGSSYKWDNAVLVTEDGGDSWEVMPDVGAFGTIAFSSPETGWVSRFYEKFDETPMVYKYQGAPFQMVTDVNDLSEPPEHIFISPNPAHDRVQVRVEDSYYIPEDLTLTNLEGKILRYWKPKGAVFDIDIEDLPPGIYFLLGRNKKARFLRRILKR